MPKFLLFSVFVISTCGLIYELISGTLASYTLGDSVTQFSTVIGAYLFAMGLGSYLSKFIEKNLVATFIRVELIIGLVGGFSASILFLLFEYVEHFRIILYSLVLVIGMLVGLEIPLVMRILKENFQSFKDLVSLVFSFDYIGALIASIAFPLLLVPHLGLARSALLFGIINVLVAFVTVYVFRDKLKNPQIWYNRSIACIFLLVLGFYFSNSMMKLTEKVAFEGNVIFNKKSHYQNIVLTRNGSAVELYLNRNLQFNSKDEYRYHEALVHPGLSILKNPKKVLILGGGDGLAVREVLKYPEIDSITLVDLDPKITHLFSTLPVLYNINEQALLSEKLTIYNQDAFLWLKNNRIEFDFVIIDLPDPTSYALGKLYSNHFYRYLIKSVHREGLVAIQSTAPYISPQSYWCIANTLESVGFQTKAYTTYIPSFGLWGFHLASKGPRNHTQTNLPKDLKYISKEVIPALFEIPKDMAKRETEINALNNQALVRYFEDEWQRYFS